MCVHSLSVRSILQAASSHRARCYHCANANWQNVRLGLWLAVAGQSRSRVIRWCRRGKSALVGSPSGRLERQLHADPQGPKSASSSSRPFFAGRGFCAIVAVASGRGSHLAGPRPSHFISAARSPGSDFAGPGSYLFVPAASGFPFRAFFSAGRCRTT
jgi:hypothetical protein